MRSTLSLRMGALAGSRYEAGTRPEPEDVVEDVMAAMSLVPAGPPLWGSVCMVTSGSTATMSPAPKAAGPWRARHSAPGKKITDLFFLN